MVSLGDDYIVQPVFKALQVLDYVVRQGRDVTLSETVRALGLPKTTVFRYLQTLSATDMLEYDLRRDRYRSGVRFRNLADIDSERSALKALAHPEMSTLLEEFGETINLAVLTDGDVVYLDLAEPARPSRSQARVGHRHPVHSTSLGKAIMAFLPDSVAEPIWARAFEALTLRTLTDTASLRRQIQDARRLGYAVEQGENEDGFMCIGVPILGRSGHPVAAMSLSAPQSRMRPEIAARVAHQLRGAAGRISERL
jgi:DNA-binding IclR family transcriptional regulator